MKKVICQYCKTKASLIDSKTIFGYRSYGMIYYCHKCGDYVGVHKKTNKPLGTLANPELSKKRVETHKVFDRLWKGMLKKNSYSESAARTLAYAWLAKCLDLKLRDCHIGKFDIDTCKKAIKVCNDNK